MTEPKVTVYGAYWCPDCRRSKKFLGEQFIPFRWVDIEQDMAGEAYVLERNNGKRIIPLIEFQDGSFLVEPTNAELAKKLGLKTEAKKVYYDLIIIGGGPAGLTTSIYASREGADVLLIERSGLGGQAGITVGLDNFPGFPEGISGQEFSERVAQQARRFGVEILQAVDVERLEMEEGYHEIAEVDHRVAPSELSQGTDSASPAVPEGEYVPHIIVLLTDGASNAGPLPMTAAQQAVDRGVRVYTIGFGTTNNTSPMDCGDDDPFGFGGGFGSPFGGGGGGGGGGGPAAGQSSSPHAHREGDRPLWGSNCC